MNILIAGDFCPKDRVSALFEEKDFMSVLEGVRDIASKVDYSIVNLECPIISGCEKPIRKCGPNLSSSEVALDALKWAEFDCVTLANNHLRDYGDEAVMNTMSCLNNKHIDYVGGGCNYEEASQVFIKEINGIKIAIINACEKEYSIATRTGAGANPLNPIEQYYKIQEEKSIADYTLVNIHGGIELYQLPTPQQIQNYHFFIDCGADVVINHHQHCYSGYEIYKNKPIFYGLGNFCFDDSDCRNEIWNQGYMVLLKMEKDISFEIIPYNQCNEKAEVQILSSDDEIKSFNDSIAKLNEIIREKHLCEEKYEEFCANTLHEYKPAIIPMFGTIGHILTRLKISPFLVTKEQSCFLYDVVNCDSHRSRLLKYLQSIIR